MINYVSEVLRNCMLMDLIGMKERVEIKNHHSEGKLVTE